MKNWKALTAAATAFLVLSVGLAYGTTLKCCTDPPCPPCDRVVAWVLGK